MVKTGKFIKPSSISNDFTLIEMLVVIAIIGILASLMLPALQNSLQSAYQVECTSHQRQLAVATHQYAEQWHNWLPPYDDGTYVWIKILTDITKIVNTTFNDAWYGTNGAGGRGIFDCPTDQRKKNVSYYINRQLTGDVMSYEKWCKITEIKSPGSVLLYTDGWVGNYNAGGYFIDHFSYVTAGMYLPDFRHLYRSNTTFVDGHVSALSIDQIPTDTRKNHFWCGFK